MEVGDIAPKTLKTIRINLISLIDGNIELKQIVRYNIVDSQSNLIPGRNRNENETTLNSGHSKSTQNVTLEYTDEAIVKSKNDTILIPCVSEFAFTGNFFSLNREPIRKAIKNEEFLFQVELEIKSLDIEILDMFLITVS